MQRSDFTNDEWEWFLRLFRHDDGLLTVAMAARLLSLGVVDEAIGGWSVNAVGREMIAREFAPAIRRQEAKTRAMRTPEAIAHREHQRLMERRRGR